MQDHDLQLVVCLLVASEHVTMHDVLVLVSQRGGAALVVRALVLGAVLIQRARQCKREALVQPHGIQLRVDVHRQLHAVVLTAAAEAGHAEEEGLWHM